MDQTDDTIVAIASPPGPAARGIVRVSGPRTTAILAAIFRPLDPTLDLDRVRSPTAIPGVLTLDQPPIAELPLDVYLWPGRRSYTRAPLAELHLLGSAPLVSAVLRTICHAGARLAQPGEFTLRAFLAGRIDLTQAEAVLGVIDARGDRALRAALAQLAGGLSQPIGQLRDALLDLLAQLEAGLDFADEDIAFITAQQVGSALAEAAATVRQLVQQLAGRSRHDELTRVVLVGYTNVGKSSLFNALVGNTAALVAQGPGTTRDYLTSTLQLGDVVCQLIDTAGAEEDTELSDIGRKAQELASSLAQECEIRLLCLDSTRATNAWEQAALANPDGAQLVIATKCDLACGGKIASAAIPTSVARGWGLDRLRTALAQVVRHVQQDDASAASTADRCGDSLTAAAEALARAADVNAAQAGEELLAAEIRAALQDLGRVVGAVYTEDILDRIFSRFCIGK